MMVREPTALIARPSKPLVAPQVSLSDFLTLFSARTQVRRERGREEKEGESVSGTPGDGRQRAGGGSLGMSILNSHVDARDL
jgi:hypothetical protein